MALCSESLSESEELSRDARDSAALLASKVYYYLGEYDEALSFALAAGSAFEAAAATPGAGEYVETVICEPHALELPAAGVLTESYSSSEGD